MVSSFSNHGFPSVHAHPTHLPAMDARISAAIDSFEASMRATFREVLAHVCHQLSLLRRDLALLGEKVSDPASMISDHIEIPVLGH